MKERTTEEILKLVRLLDKLPINREAVALVVSQAELAELSSELGVPCVAIAGFSVVPPPAKLGTSERERRRFRLCAHDGCARHASEGSHGHPRHCPTHEREYLDRLYGQLRPRL